MHVFAFMTGTIVEFTNDEGDYKEEHGWIDERWSMHEVWDNRNYVKPVAIWRDYMREDIEEHPTVNDFIRATVDEYLGTAEDNGDGTWYGVDSPMTNQSLRDGKVYTYALHFFYKDLVNGKWEEIPVTLTDG